jgi:hypothetical protein
MLLDCFKRYFIIAILEISTCQIAASQDFFRDYKQYMIHNIHKEKINTRLLNKSVRFMKKAFHEYETQTQKSMLDNDIVFFVNYYNIETAEHTTVVWNHTQSFYYNYRYKTPLGVTPDATKWIGWYKPEFKRWVETSDTTNYGKYGRRSSWLDAPRINFVVAKRIKGHWEFIQSGSYSNNIETLN